MSHAVRLTIAATSGNATKAAVRLRLLVENPLIPHLIRAIALVYHTRSRPGPQKKYAAAAAGILVFDRNRPGIVELDAANERCRNIHWEVRQRMSDPDAVPVHRDVTPATDCVVAPTAERSERAMRDAQR